MNKFLLPFFLVVFSFSLQAQDTPVQKCGHDHLMQIMEAQHPGFKEVVNRNYDDARNHVSQNRNDVYEVGVVVHVVYKNADENISDARIENVIDRLNEDFRHTNANAVNIRPEFQGIVGDAGIQFNLESIVRVETTTLFELDLFGGTLPDNVKQSSEGGSDAWDTDSYMNIWVCKIEGGALLGYAYPPSCAPNWPAGATAPSSELDGVVVHYEAFDVGATFSTQGTTVPIEGRTLTHEVGHYMGLRHIWGDGLLAQLGIPDCSEDDGLLDTPNQGVPSQFACDPTQNSCEEGTPDLPDMFENYMDYADETCMAAFTNDQMNVMRASLEGCRSGIVQQVLSVDESQALANEFTLSPNPTTGLVNLVMEGNDSYQVTVRDILGSQVINPMMNRGDRLMELDLSGLANGVYFVEIQRGNVRAAKKVVLAH